MIQNCASSVCEKSTSVPATARSRSELSPTGWHTVGKPLVGFRSHLCKAALFNCRFALGPREQRVCFTVCHTVLERGGVHYLVVAGGMSWSWRSCDADLVEAATIFLFSYHANGSAPNIPEFKLKKALTIIASPCVVHVVLRGEAPTFTMQCRHRNRTTFVARHHGICFFWTGTGFQSFVPRKHKNVKDPFLRR